MRPNLAWLALLGLTVVAVPTAVVYATGFAAVLASPLGLVCLVTGSCVPAALGASVTMRDRRNELAASRGEPTDVDHGRRLSRRLAQRERELQITYSIYRELESRLAMMEAKIDGIERGASERNRGPHELHSGGPDPSRPLDPIITLAQPDGRPPTDRGSLFPVRRAADLYARNGEDGQA